MLGELDIAVVWHRKLAFNEMRYERVISIYQALDKIAKSDHISYLTWKDINDWIIKSYPGSIYTSNNECSYIRFATVQDKMHFLLTYC